MKIIALKGRGKCGKSETLGIHVRGILRERNSVHYEDCTMDTREQIIVNGMVVDICPPGDNEKEVTANIAFVEKHPCDVLFTATRTRGGSRNSLKEYAVRKNAELKEVWKRYNDDLDLEGQTEKNRETAEELMKML